MPLSRRRLHAVLLCFGLALLAGNAVAQTSAADLVARGAYLARAGDCVSCHTAPGGQPYAGGYQLDTPFGYLLSPNITPDGATGIGRWSADDFWRALHQGVNQRGQDMYPVMPFDFYTRVTREDSDAIYAYLRSLPAVSNAVVVNHLRFPFNQRWSMAVWRELYFSEGSYKPDPSKSAAWNRGAYLVEGLGHCSACHSPRNALGGIEKDKAFTGATIDGWFALNLTSELHSGLGSWTVEQIATYLKTGAVAGKTTALGPMALVVKNSTSQMSAADLLAMATYLKNIPANSTLRQGKPAPDPTRAAGASLYLDHCAGCHQAGGRGMPGVFPPLAGNGVVLSSDPADILKVVLHGVPAQGKYVPMPAFAGQLNDQQVADLANYLRTSWGNGAAPNTTAAMAARLRGATR
ncbi:MAG: cytochrome c [Burkholderiaceae bacterium]|jgi:mono/diheme cytochrome c family protein|nr:cytochrome c [Burkholderiaceae bacterium]